MVLFSKNTQKSFTSPFSIDFYLHSELDVDLYLYPYLSRRSSFSPLGGEMECSIRSSEMH